MGAKGRPRNIYVMLAIAVFSVSWAAIFVRLSGAPGAVCAFWRMFFSSIITFLIAGSELTGIRNQTPHHILLAAASGAFLAAHFTSWMESLFLISVSLSTTIVVTHPIFALLFAFFLLREMPSRRQVVGLMIALMGIFMMTTKGRFVYPEGITAWGIALAFIGALCGGIYFALGRLLRASGMSLMSYTLIAYSTSVIVLLPYVLINKISLIDYPPRTWLFFLLLALVPMLSGHTLLNYVLRYAKAVAVTGVVMGEPVGATLLAWLLLNELPTFEELLGMAITLIGIGLVVTGESS